MINWDRLIGYLIGVAVSWTIIITYNHFFRQNRNTNSVRGDEKMRQKTQGEIQRDKEREKWINKKNNIALIISVISVLFNSVFFILNILQYKR